MSNAILESMKTNTFLILIAFFLLQSVHGQTKYPMWKEGEMEIHHINTGRCESVFYIFPDGTTMIGDAGASGTEAKSDPRIPPHLPDDSRQPGEWIARYILMHLPSPDKKEIDYFLLTHFHGDHMGQVSDDMPKTKKGGDYLLSGLTEVAEYIQFKKLVDRDFPSYNYPIPLGGKTMDNYKSFVKWTTQNTNMKIERFVPGSNEQFVLVKNPGKYAKVFEVRNLVANGEVWTGVGNQTKKFFPETDRQSINENKCCSGIRISYGKFDYFNGGDISGKLPFNSKEQWRDIERPVGEVAGPVEVCKANHHAFVDAMSDYFISCVQPQVFVINVCHVSHINLETLKDMTNKGIYPGDRDIFATNFPEISRQYLGEQNIQRYKNGDGHVVIKVEPGGNRYHVYLLDATNESFSVKAVYGPYTCR